MHLCNIHGFNALAKSINSAWDQILFYLEKADVNTVQKENQFVRNSCGVIFWDVWKNTDDLYKSFRAYISKNTQKKIDGSETPDENILSVDDLKEWLQAYYKFFLSASRTYAYLFNRRGFFKSSTEGYFSIELDEIFKKLRNHGSRDTVTPLVLTLMHHYYDQPKLRDKIVETVRITEILNFRLYCLPKIFFRADTKTGKKCTHMLIQFTLKEILILMQNLLMKILHHLSTIIRISSSYKRN
ncbi:MAG: hypothetical protein IPJ75_13060 [Ignavibacteriales bacterium]|nr:hypothetical protein [Ignavibacteriales bacterium]